MGMYFICIYGHFECDKRMKEKERIKLIQGGAYCIPCYYHCIDDKLCCVVQKLFLVCYNFLFFYSLDLCIYIIRQNNNNRTELELKTTDSG